MDKPPMGDTRTKAERLADAEMLTGDDEARKKGTKAGGRYDQVQRDLAIYRAHLKSVSHYDLAEIYGITPQTVAGIVRRMRRENQRLSTMDPVEVVEELTSQVDAALSDLAAVAAKEKGSVRVTAITSRLNGLLAKGKWLQATGILPAQANELRVHLDGTNIAQQVIAVLNSRGLLDDPEVTKELLQATGVEPEVIDGWAEEMPLDDE